MKALLVPFAVMIFATSAMAQTGQSDVDARSDSGSLSAGQKESMPSTEGKGENQHQEPQTGASSDTEYNASTGASTGEQGMQAEDDGDASLKKPITSDPEGVSE